MNTQKKLYLLPYRFQIVGCIIAAISTVVFFWGLFTSKQPAIQNDWMVFGYAFLLLGVFLIGLSREKVEDEFTLFTRTRSALTAIVIVFGLRIIFALTFSILAVSVSAETFNNPHLAQFGKAVRQLTNYGGAFILYVILYKVRLARYNIRMARESQEENDQTD